MAAATLTGERCRFTNVPEIEDVRVLADTLRDLGRRRRPPGPEHLRDRLGRRRVAVRAARGGGQDARQLHPARAAPGPLRAGHHQQPGRRPDRAAAGRPARRRDARARAPRSSTATATTSRRRRVGCAAPRSASRSCRSWAPRTRCWPRPSPTATPTIRPAAQEPEVDDLIVFLQNDGRRGRADRARHDRGRGPQAPARRRAPGGPRSHRGGHVRGRGRGHRRPGHARGRAVRPPGRLPRHRSGGSASASRAARDTIEVDGTALLERRLPRVRHRDRAVPGPRDRPPAAHLRAPDPGRRAVPASTRRSSRTASSGWPRPAGWASWRTQSDAQHATITGRAALRGAEVEIGDLRAGASLILAALAAEGTSTIHGAHHVHRGYENIERQVPRPRRQDRAPRGRDPGTSS